MSGLAGVLVGLTASISEWQKVPEIEIDKTEAEEFMNASQNVLRHYAIDTTQKGADFLTLFFVAGNIIGSRIAAYRLRLRMEEQEGRPQTVNPPFHNAVMPMPNGGLHVRDESEIQF